VEKLEDSLSGFQKTELNRVLYENSSWFTAAVVSNSWL